MTVTDITRDADLSRGALLAEALGPDPRVRLMHPDEPLNDPVGADFEPGDLYGPEEG